MFGPKKTEREYEGRQSEGEDPCYNNATFERVPAQLQQDEETERGQDDSKREQGGNSLDERSHGLGAHLQFAWAESGKSQKLVGDEGQAQERPPGAVVSAAGHGPSPEVVSGERDGDGGEDYDTCCRREAGPCGWRGG